MPELNFTVQSAEPQPFAAAPLMVFKLKIHQTGAADPIHSIALHCQIRIEPARRKYTPAQQEALFEVFGPPENWSQSLRPMLWTHANATVSAFEADTIADLPVPCSYDLGLAATRYFDALGNDGKVPLCFLFSGTIFYQSSAGALQAAPVPWSKESDFALPVRIWKKMMDQHYAGQALLRLDKEIFDQLRSFKNRMGYLSFEQAISELLEMAQERVPG